MSDMGVKKIETVGTEFDYNTHMAISTEPSDEYDCWLQCRPPCFTTAPHPPPGII